MDELFSPPLMVAACGMVAVLFGAAIVYLEALVSGEA
jgi:hypothetical protein